jgi:predicted Zn-dependent protease
MDLNKLLSAVAGEADWIGLRYVEERSAQRAFRDGKPARHEFQIDRGLMVEALVEGHFGYAGTQDLTEAGVRRAALRARDLAAAGAAIGVARFDAMQRPRAVGRYDSPVERPFADDWSAEIGDSLARACRAMQVSDRIVTATAETLVSEYDHRFVSSNGSDVTQHFSLVTSALQATAKDGGQIQKRSGDGGYTLCRQAGAEHFDREVMLERAERAGREALELLAADDCPTDTLDLILMPDQMYLQIHESIGHPLELDRILGDERNYAGWSFVKPEDFGQLQYGSSLLNVIFDPTAPGAYASYAFDDAGIEATREYLIRNGVLLRGLGSAESQHRLQKPGVANARAASWNRAPIDRMANIDLEPGDATLAQMIASVERGVLMQTNRSWSIDDYRRKFQFGCEYGQLIEDGRITRTVRNPNYRGVSVPFWNSLAMVGDAASREQHGSPWCGKGEPNQVIRVGHAAPPCLFRGVEVFGGAA